MPEMDGFELTRELRAAPRAGRHEDHRALGQGLRLRPAARQGAGRRRLHHQADQARDAARSRSPSIVSDHVVGARTGACTARCPRPARPTRATAATRPASASRSAASRCYIFDCGSGIKRLSDRIMAPRRAALLGAHLHLAHALGPHQHHARSSRRCTCAATRSRSTAPTRAT